MGVSAVILAGGRATRMQGEKPLRLLKGRTLLQHSNDLVAPLADEIIVASGTRNLDLPDGAISAPDSPGFTGQGPLAGILAGLNTASHEHIIVLACDLPNLPLALLQRMLDRLADTSCCWCEHSGHPEPLAAAVRKTPAKAIIDEALKAGQNKVMPCWLGLPHRILGEADLTEFQPLQQTFANINTLQDLEAQEGSNNEA
ncbi:MAG: molybdenum cofactor guanylyltransferase [Planctomycetes bacterium]|nr:molybdenum cofactor guanylyltransferase [Planctomycetota bacterium]MCA8947312.1 molybdenum cofactor guanylyltransferase [Planctomycetota bacterium]